LGGPQSHSKSFTHLLCLTLLALTNVLQDCKTFCWEDVQMGVTNLVGSDYHQHSTTELLTELLKMVTFSDGK
jgi:hypothetical protein